MNGPTVTIIIPCFNQGRFLGDAVNSVLAQSYANWECLIVNNGSTDSTEDVAQRYAVQDTRIRYFNHSKRGVSGVRNKGLAEARGKFIQFLDADDIIKPQKIEAQLQAASKETGLIVAYCDYYTCPEDDLNVQTSRYLDPRFRTENKLTELIARWETKMSIPMHCFLLDSRFFTQHKIRFDERLKNHVDWDCWIGIFSLAPTILYTDSKLAVYRLHDASMCTNKLKMRNGFLRAIDKQQIRFLGKKEILVVLAQKRREIETLYHQYTWAARMHHELKTFFGRLSRAIKSRARKLYTGK